MNLSARESPIALLMVSWCSLAVDETTMPAELTVTARAMDDNEIMGIRHTSLAVEGVQFHPESIMTGVGMAMLENFLVTCRKEAHK